MMIAVYYEKDGSVENYYDSIEELKESGFEVLYTGHETLWNAERDGEKFIIEFLDESEGER